MMNIGYFIASLVGVWFVVVAFRRRRGSHDWRYRGQMLLGAVGIFLGGLSLIEPPHLRATREARIFYSVEGLLAGAFLGVFATLCLAGWFGDLLGQTKAQAGAEGNQGT